MTHKDRDALARALVAARTLDPIIVQAVEAMLKSQVGGGGLVCVVSCSDEIAPFAALAMPAV